MNKHKFQTLQDFMNNYIQVSGNNHETKNLAIEYLESEGYTFRKNAGAYVVLDALLLHSINQGKQLALFQNEHGKLMTEMIDKLIVDSYRTSGE